MNITNIFEPMQGIIDKLILDNVFDASMIFKNVNLQDFSNKIFRGMTDADSNACIVIHEGFNPNKHANGSTQRITCRVRVIVVSPDSLYYENAGVKFIEVINSLKSLSLENCLQYDIIEDVHEFNAVGVSQNMIGLPILYGFDVIT